MGMIIIEVSGSFEIKREQFMALDHGHAHCVCEAQKYLNTLLIDAINKDHKLHEEGAKPNLGFQKK